MSKFTGSKKATQFTESVIREMTRLSDAHNAVNLSQGFPDFPAPDHIKVAACAAIHADINQYAVTWGARPLREAIAREFTRRYGVPVCQHAGGVGLCEHVQHFALFDYIAVSADLTDRVIEYVDHLHDHFVCPVVMRNARYVPPEAPGYSAEIKVESLDRHRFPGGPTWIGLRST